MKKYLRPAFKIHGGKRYLYQWIIDHLPENYQEMDYVEPFIGAGSVFMNKLPCASGNIEVINDLDPGVVSIFTALRDDPKTFIRRITKTKYCEGTFNRALKKHKFEDYVDHAVNEFIVRRMSRGGLKKAFGWSDRKRGGKPGDLNAWETIREVLPLISDRLQGVRIFNKTAIEIIKAFDDPKTLCYCDPTYLPQTRTAPVAYEFEMTENDHIALAETLCSFKGKVIVSGYPSPVYNRLYKGWRTVQKKIANHASQQKSKQMKTEVLFMNY